MAFFECMYSAVMLLLVYIILNQHNKVSKDFQIEYSIRQDMTFDLIVPLLGQYLHSLATLIGTPFKYHVGPLCLQNCLHSL